MVGNDSDRTMFRVVLQLGVFFSSYSCITVSILDLGLRAPRFRYSLSYFRLLAKVIIFLV